MQYRKKISHLSCASGLYKEGTAVMHDHALPCAGTAQRFFSYWDIEGSVGIPRGGIAQTILLSVMPQR
jgi:hypothetical protein